MPNNHPSSQQTTQADTAHDDDQADYIFYTLLSHGQVFYISCVCLLLVFWLKHASITHYLQQSYQISPFWQPWQQSAILKMGNQLNTGFNQIMAFSSHKSAAHALALQADTKNTPNHNAGSDNHQPFTLESAMAALPTELPTDLATNQTTLAAKANKLTKQTAATQQTTRQYKPTPITPVQISKTSSVFFVGDSLMEGVAPKAMRLLRKRYGIKSINLSKQNTGLSYNTFFNWTEAVENTFAKHENIRLMVVFLGANDPWDVPNPKKPWQYIRFGTKAWNKLYLQKVNKLLVSADNSGASVLWLLMPAMKKQKLNQHIGHLNALYVQAVSEFNQQKQLENTHNHDNAHTEPNQFIVWATQPLLSTKQSISTKSSETLANSSPQQILHALTSAETLQTSSKTMPFSATAQVGEKLVKVRTGDGIHFTSKGQQALADALLTFIQVND